MVRIQQHFVILLTASYYPYGDIYSINFNTSRSICKHGRINCSSSSNDDDEDCGFDELPASIDGTIRCMGQGECYSSEFEFDGERVKHCNFLTSSDE